MIQTMFYVLASIALIAHLIEKLFNFHLGIKEIRSAVRVKRILKRGNSK